MLRVAERSGFGVGGVLLVADVGAAQDAEAFGVGGHDAVLDSVVHHLDEVSGAVRAAVEITRFGGALQRFAPRGAGNLAAAGRQGTEDGVEMLHWLRLAPD